MKRTIRNILRSLGYEVQKHRRGSEDVSKNGLYETYSYLKLDGTFDYGAYVRIQTEGNKRKVQSRWVQEENIAFLSQYIRGTIGNPTFGICHGTRNGKEQMWFRDHLGCDVIGTEISDNAGEFPHTIQWDFHETRPEWIGAADFIYSNAFDHSYDPEKSINAWMSCLKRTGICIIEHTSSHEPASELDPFGAPISLMPYLILTWGKGQFSVRELLDAPTKADTCGYAKYLVIQHAPISLTAC